nr:hypothetical protein Iba_scaffold2300CG1520 [Ipomoea batatas]
MLEDPSNGSKTTQYLHFRADSDALELENVQISQISYSKISGGCESNSTHFPRNGGFTKVASSSSSETRMDFRPLLTKALIKTSFESTSSFFCSSPCTQVSPASPMSFAKPACTKAVQTNLQPRTMWLRRMVKSPRDSGCFVCSFSTYLVMVIKSVR